MTANCPKSSHRSTTISQGEIEEPRDSRKRWHWPPRAKRVSPPHTHMVWHSRVSLEKRPGPVENVRTPEFGRRIYGGGQGRWSGVEQRPAASPFPRGRASPRDSSGTRARRKNSRTAKEPERQSTIRVPCLGILRSPFF